MTANIQEVLRRLQHEYGERAWYMRRDPVSELVFTILTQNTSDRNAFVSYSRLVRRFPTWDAVADGDVAEIEKAIAIGGLSKTKAPRIKKVLQQIREERGGFDLSFLETLPLEEAKAWLGRLDGVGPKTVACVLMFSFNRPAMPVDTHVYRIAQRLGLIDAKMSVERAHEALERSVPPEQVYPLHVDLIEHGRRVCQARRPQCDLCVLSPLCPSSAVSTAPIAR